MALLANPPLKRVLVVDDDLAVRVGVTRVLSMSGYDVRTAEDGRAALELLESWTPDVILLDMHMPQMDGPTFAAAYRAGRSGRGTCAPILIFSNADDLVERAAEIGADGYIAKHAGAPQLIDAVRRFSTSLSGVV